MSAVGGAPAGGGGRGVTDHETARGADQGLAQARVAGHGAGGRRAGHGPLKRGIRSRALLLTSLALAFYFGFIALTLFRSHHG